MKALDLFCGAGGATKGLQRAGFHVTGVDINPQPHYCGDEFYQADALTFPLEGYDFIWASPPCQAYSIMRNLPWLREKQYPRLIRPIRELLVKTAGVYCIENVMDAKHDGMMADWLCGTMFGLPVYRHRLFETNFWWLRPQHVPHDVKKQTVRNGRTLGSRARDVVFSVAEDRRGKESWLGRRGEAGRGLTVKENGARRPGANVGHAPGVEAVRLAMGIDWMSREEITQAIPPAYAEFIGREAMKQLEWQ